MTQTHLLSDSLTRIRNAQMVFAKEVVILHSKLVDDVLQVMLNNGYIFSKEKFEIKKGINRIKVQLKYDNRGSPSISSLAVLSKPGRRLYTSYKSIVNYYSGLGTVVLSTSKGVLSDYMAKKYKAGGEVLCKIF